MVRRALSLFSAGQWRARRARSAGLAFDRKFGTDTQSPVSVEVLDIPGAVAAHAVQYEASALPKLRRVLRHLGIDFSQYVFIDMGSGKGLVVFEAARHPFAEVIGVEISRRLHETAAGNLERVRRHLCLRAPVTLLHMNALDHDCAAPRQVVYLYNPFDEVILRELMRALETRLQRGAKDILIAYVNPLHKDMLEVEFPVTAVHRHATLIIYRLHRRAPE